MNENPTFPLEDTTDICQLIRQSLRTSANWNQLSDAAVVFKVPETGDTWQMLAGSQVRRDGRLVKVVESKDGQNPGLNPGRISPDDVVILRSAPQDTSAKEERAFVEWKGMAQNRENESDIGRIESDTVDSMPVSNYPEMPSDTNHDTQQPYLSGSYRSAMSTSIAARSKPTALEVDDLADILCEAYNGHGWRPYYCGLILRHGISKIKALYQESLTKNKPANYFSFVASSYDRKYQRDLSRGRHS